jgi:nucleotide-binding universal stress UspA family protein
MTDTTYRIVVGTDFSDIADLALENAFNLASREERAEVHVISAVQHLDEFVQMDLPDSPAYRLPLDEAQEKLEAHVGARVAEWQERTGKTFSRCVTHLSTEFPATGITQLGIDLDAQLIIVGTHGRRGLKRFMLGSVAEAVVRMAEAPVLIVRPKVADVPVPQMAKACPKCVKAREDSHGKELWCEEHRERHGRRHTYHYQERISRDSTMPLMSGLRR